MMVRGQERVVRGSGMYRRPPRVWYGRELGRRSLGEISPWHRLFIHTNRAREAGARDHRWHIHAQGQANRAPAHNTFHSWPQLPPLRELLRKRSTAEDKGAAKTGHAHMTPNHTRLPFAAQGSVRKRLRDFAHAASPSRHQGGRSFAVGGYLSERSRWNFGFRWR